MNIRITDNDLYFSENSIKCFVETFYVEFKINYYNTLSILNEYYDNYTKNYSIITDKLEKIKKDFVGGGLPKIPDLYQYESYQDHTNLNKIYLSFSKLK